MSCICYRYSIKRQWYSYRCIVCSSVDDLRDKILDRGRLGKPLLLYKGLPRDIKIENCEIVRNADVLKRYSALFGKSSPALVGREIFVFSSGVLPLPYVPKYSVTGITNLTSILYGLLFGSLEESSKPLHHKFVYE